MNAQISGTLDFIVQKAMFKAVYSACVPLCTSYTQFVCYTTAEYLSVLHEI